MKLRVKAVVFTIAGVAISLIAVFVSKTVIMSRSEGYIHGEVSTLPDCDTALVLGCSRFLSDGRANLFFEYRTQKAYELWNSGKVESIIVSGDNHAVEYDELTDMKEALMELGVAGERIHCDYAGFAYIGLGS